MTTTPTPRPIPTHEDRMRDATAKTDAPGTDPGINLTELHMTAESRAAMYPAPPRTFAAYLDATERDQLDARAACAEQERDEALDELQELKQHHTLLHTRFNALENDLRSANRAVQEFAAQAERNRHAIADMAKLRAELGAAQELVAVVDDVTEQLDRARARYATRQDGQPLKHVSVLGTCIACGSKAPNGRCPNDAALGSAAPRAQDAPAVAKLIAAAHRVHAARDTVLPRREALADLAAAADELGADWMAGQLAAEARDYQWAPDADTERVLGVFTAPLRQAGYGQQEG